MNYEEFLQEAKEGLTELLSGNHPGISIEIVDVDKIQKGSYRGLSIREAGSNMAMSMNMQGVFERVQDGASPRAVIESFAYEVEERLADQPVFDVGRISDYDTMKEHLSIQMVSVKGNEDVLRGVPHTVMEDLAAVYRIQMGDDASILVTNDLVKNLGISPEQMKADALRSAPEHEPATIRSMAEVMAELMPPGMEIPGGEPPMYVAAKEGQAYGAGILAYPGFMELAADRLGGDFFILPSSIHEILLIPDNGSYDWRELEEMVQSVNASTVLPEEQLSDHAYRYDSKDKVFERADATEGRLAAKAKEQSLNKQLKSVQEKTGKKSVLEELKNNKEVCDKVNATHTKNRSQPDRGAR